MRLLRPFDPWRNPWCTCPPKYTLNPYTGCGHGCKYCYISSYIRDAFNPRPKDKIIRYLARDLREAVRPNIVAISYSSDPYTPPEDRLRMMPAILKLFRDYGWKVLIATKSNLVTRDIDLLVDMDCVVSITLTTLDGWLASLIEPGAPKPSDRLDAIYRLAQDGVPVSVRLDPIIPSLNDDLEEIRELVSEAISMGARHIVSSVYKAKPDSMRRLIDTLGRELDGLLSLYSQGFNWYGYRYPPSSYRYRVLKMVKSVVEKVDANVGFTTCREGFKDIDDPGTYCDAQHLLGLSYF